MDNNERTSSKTSLQLPWKTRIALFFISAVTDFSRRSNGTVNRRLFSLLESFGLKTSSNPKPRHGVHSADIIVDPDPSRNLWFRIFVPNNNNSDEKRLPVVVFFHGGGFVYLAPDYKSYDHVCHRFARNVPAVVVSVNYRLAPEHPYPAQYDDGFDVLEFLDRQAHVLPPNADLSRCFLAGDSAGANLAHHVAKRACSHSDFAHLKVIGMVAIQPFFGGEERTKSEIELGEIDVLVSRKRTDWMWKAFMPDGDRDHEVINVSGPKAADISKLDEFPPTMVVVAGFDSLKDWQIRYYEWLEKSGKQTYLVQYPNMFHAFYVFPELPESGHLVSQIKQFIHNQCSNLVSN